MENILSYHDWYSKYFHIQENVGVINVSNGVFGLSNQPIFNEKGDLWLMMEGEVYDSDNLRKELINKGHKISGEGYDECILHLYEEIGDRFVHRINGQFVVVIHSIPDGKLLIVNDRLGFRPLYYYRSKDEFVFSSEMKGVLCA
jgi:asparagine synthase (glutamine-hydrolysing)